MYDCVCMDACIEKFKNFTFNQPNSMALCLAGCEAKPPTLKHPSPGEGMGITFILT